MTFIPCWTCAQPATHVLTREGSNTLHACDNCTRIDRAEAESRGWTVKSIAETAPTTYTAAIATASDVVEYVFCDVAVAEDDIITFKVDSEGNETPVYGMSNRIVLEPVILPVRVDDDDKLTKATHAADEILAAHGWSVTGNWEIADNAMYAAVERA